MLLLLERCAPWPGCRLCEQRKHRGPLDPGAGQQLCSFPDLEDLHHRELPGWSSNDLPLMVRAYFLDLDNLLMHSV